MDFPTATHTINRTGEIRNIMVSSILIQIREGINKSILPQYKYNINKNDEMFELFKSDVIDFLKKKGYFVEYKVDFDFFGYTYNKRLEISWGSNNTHDKNDNTHDNTYRNKHDKNDNTYINKHDNTHRNNKHDIQFETIEDDWELVSNFDKLFYDKN